MYGSNFNESDFKSYFKLRDQRIVYLGQVQIDFFEDKEFPVF